MKCYMKTDRNGFVRAYRDIEKAKGAFIETLSNEEFEKICQGLEMVSLGVGISKKGNLYYAIARKDNFTNCYLSDCRVDCISWYQEEWNEHLYFD